MSSSAKTTHTSLVLINSWKIKESLMINFELNLLENKGTVELKVKHSNIPTSEQSSFCVESKVVSGYT